MLLIIPLIALIIITLFIIGGFPEGDKRFMEDKEIAELISGSAHQRPMMAISMNTVYYYYIFYMNTVYCYIFILLSIRMLITIYDAYIIFKFKNNHNDSKYKKFVNLYIIS